MSEKQDESKFVGGDDDALAMLKLIGMNDGTAAEEGLPPEDEEPEKSGAPTKPINRLPNTKHIPPRKKGGGR